MRAAYDDITSKITERPQWWDYHGTPRYAPFTPALCPDLAARQAVLLQIACPSCQERFLVEMHGTPLAPLGPLGLLHYGHPPYHDCVGDAMQGEVLAIVEAWQRAFHRVVEWERQPHLEGRMQELRARLEAEQQG